jgi:hypothetical protein
VPHRNDEPVLLDALDRWNLVREIGDALATCDPPHVYGVHGHWGLGKTSVMHQVQFYLTGQCPTYGNGAVEVARKVKTDAGKHQEKLCVVWFEAWRYQHEPAPSAATAACCCPAESISSPSCTSRFKSISPPVISRSGWWRSG